jgi:hypothetical protein
MDENWGYLQKGYLQKIEILRDGAGGLFWSNGI